MTESPLSSNLNNLIPGEEESEQARNLFSLVQCADNSEPRPTTSNTFLLNSH